MCGERTVDINLSIRRAVMKAKGRHRSGDKVEEWLRGKGTFDGYIVELVIRKPSSTLERWETRSELSKPSV